MVNLRKGLLGLLVVSLVASVALVGCSSSEGGEEAQGTEITIASQGYPEVEILAEMAKILIEEKTPHTVKRISNTGTSIANHEMVVNGDADIMTSFTGTYFLGLLEMTLTDEWRNPNKVYQYVKDKLDEEYDLYAFPPFGYNNVYAIAVPEDWAEEHNVTKVSDLKPYAADMTLAVDHSWLHYPGQGYDEFTKLYGFEFNETPEMDFGLMYRAAGEGQVDAICGYSTDGQLLKYNLRVLEDDKGFNPPYNGIYVGRNDTLEKYPEVKQVLEELAGKIDTETMTSLNHEVAVKERDPADVARDFLVETGLIEE